MKQILLFLALLVSGMVVNAQTTVLFEENFTDPVNPPADWTLVDQDGDGNNWQVNTYESEIYMASNSWLDPNALTPENYLITPSIDLTGLSGEVKLYYFVSAASSNYFLEHYKLAVSTTDNQVASFGTILLEETLTSEMAGGAWTERMVDISSLIGNNIYLTWCHYNCTDQYKLLLDSVKVVYQSNIGIADRHEDQLYVSPNPASGFLKVEGRLSNARVEIVNMLGETVISRDNVTRQCVLNVSNLTDGLYFVRTLSEGVISTRKVKIN